MNRESFFVDIACRCNNSVTELLGSCPKCGLERKKACRRWRGQRTYDLAQRIGHARRAENEALALAAHMAVLADWLRRDILSSAGPDQATRRELYDFVVTELRLRESLGPHRIGPVVPALSNQRHQRLAFTAQLDQDLAAWASQFQLPVATLRAVFNIEALAADSPPAGRLRLCCESNLATAFLR